MTFSKEMALAKACAVGNASALACFEKQVLAPVQRELTRRFGPDTADEAVQQTRTRLLVAAPGTEPKIATYQGRGPLETWVRTVAIRLAIDSLNSAGAIDAVEDLALATDRELQEHAQRYQPSFEEAFRQALGLLSRRERVALRMSMTDGLPNEKIAAIFHVHPSSISRLLARARSTLRENTVLALQHILNMGKTSANSLVRAHAALWQLSLGRCLREAGGPTTSSS